MRNAESTPALPFRIPHSTFRILMYRTSDFDYSLPPELIAQHPLPDRAASRLLVLERASGAIRHAQFGDILDLMAPGDMLVLNVSRVIPARLRGMRDAVSGMRGPGGKAEFLLVRELADGTWLATGAPLAKYGEVPLPPYIRRAPTSDDRERYQTVYAAHDGSVAAPTAGLHFTRDLLDRPRDAGVALAELDLHVGPGTFKPVEAEDLAHHAMYAEPYRVSEQAAGIINERRQAGGRVWAVGTTVVRTLETLARDSGRISPDAGETRLFIHPPYAFRAVDRLLTNFHLPRSTLLMLVCAFGGYENVMRAYGEAVREQYRFYSYGDAMAIV